MKKMRAEIRVRRKREGKIGKAIRSIFLPIRFPHFFGLFLRTKVRFLKLPIIYPSVVSLAICNLFGGMPTLVVGILRRFSCPRQAWACHRLSPIYAIYRTLFKRHYTRIKSSRYCVPKQKLGTRNESFLRRSKFLPLKRTDQ
jgi:hypothetical protein